MRNSFILFTCLGLLAFGCSSKVTTSGTSGTGGKYNEDLSVWRPATEKTIDSVRTSSTPERSRTNQYVEAKHAITNDLDVVLDSIYDQNLSKGLVDGFTIQVYSGIKREDALNVKKDLSRAVPDLESDVQYRQPNFRVRAGKYFTLLEAQKDYLAVKRYFPNAIVIPDRVSMD
jgi:hypothetical protein